MSKVRFVLIACLSFSILFAQEEGENLGLIEFPNSGAADAQKAFIEGVLWLHSFEYPEAREAFQAASRIDPDFALARWGEAMTWNHPVWHEVNLEEGRAALGRLGATLEERLSKAPTEREKDYLRAVDALFGEGDKQQRDDAYAEAMRRMSEKYPHDREAASFYSLSLLGTCNQGREIPVYMKAAAVAEEVFRVNQRHPGALHYMIHSYDDPVHAPLGLRPARLYAKVAPSAGHALHMPSHVFLALGMWDETVASNIDSFRAGEERVARRNLPVDERNFHALFWLEYGLLQQGRYSEARKRLEVIRSDFGRSPSRRTAAHLALMQSAYLVETRAWETDRVEIDDSMRIGPTAMAADLFAAGAGALAMGKTKQTEQILEKMQALRKKAQEGSSHHGEYQRPAVQTVEAEVMEMELEALLLQARGETKEALALIEEAARREEGIAAGFGPPSPVKPSHELAGEMFLKAGRPAEAQEWFERSLARNPRRALSLLGMAQAAAQAGDSQAAAEARRELRAVWRNADSGILENSGAETGSGR